MAGVVSSVVSFGKSLWSDPFRWQLVKSLALFGGAIYVAREMAAFDASIDALPNP